MSSQLELTQEQYNLWNEETGKVYDSMGVLSWEACEMIAWNRIAEKMDLCKNESLG